MVSLRDRISRVAGQGWRCSHALRSAASALRMFLFLVALVVVVVASASWLVSAVQKARLLYKWSDPGDQGVTYVEQIQILRQLRELEPANEGYRYLLASVLGMEAEQRQKAGDNAHAWALLDEALGTDVGNITVYALCVRAHIAEKQWCVADFFASRAAAWEPASEASRCQWRRSSTWAVPLINRNLAQAALRDGEYAVAVRAFFRWQRLLRESGTELDCVTGAQWVNTMQSSLELELTAEERESLSKFVECHLALGTGEDENTR
jgi:tetratricopeptide (TPR) repeat protein